jgi:dTDP-4-amino-4,6-dideoxygalactose transaminase
VFTDDDTIAALAQSIRVHGKGTMKYDNVRIGLNSRLDSIQAAILQVKLKAFKDYELDDVNKVADKYTELLAEALVDKAVLPCIPEGFLSSWAQYTIQLKDRETRDAVQAALKEKGIPSMVYYPKPMHDQQAFGIEGEYGFDCSNTAELCGTVLSLPMHPYMSDEDIKEVVDALKEALK